jgi:hypothetical protein
VFQKGETVPQYAEIENPAEIRRLNDTLWQTLRDNLTHAEDRIIGNPHGKGSAKVCFLSGTGADVFYWSGRISKDKKTAFSIFGHGEPGSNESLNIDVQFNLSITQFSRRLGGAFLRDISTNEIVLAHRGIVNIGHSHVRKAELFSKMADIVLESITGDRSGKYLFIGKINSPNLIEEIDGFSEKLRRFVRAIKTSATK